MLKHTSWRVAAEIAAVLTLAACGGGGGGDTAVPPPCSIPDKTCYVRISGSDSNSGADPAHAFRSITKAAQLALDGYTIVVGRGTYHEGVTTATQGAAPQGLAFIADAQGGRSGDPAGPVILDATGTSVAAGFKLTNSSGTLIDGFEIRGGSDGGIVIKSSSNNFTIQNCLVHDNPGDGIRVQDSTGVLVFNNLVYSNGGEGVGIVGNVSGSANARVYSNTIFGNTDHGLTIGTSSTASPGASVHNNIVQGNDSVSPRENIKLFTNPNSQLGYDGDFNLVFQGVFNPTSLKGTHDIVQDAMFVNPGIDEFHLSANSPGVNGGGPLNLPTSQTNILRARTTTGTGLDSGVFDLGFHFLP